MAAVPMRTCGTHQLLPAEHLSPGHGTALNMMLWWMAFLPVPRKPCSMHIKKHCAVVLPFPLVDSTSTCVACAAMAQPMTRTCTNHVV